MQNDTRALKTKTSAGVNRTTTRTMLASKTSTL
jgi:hypothetical protein